MRSLIEVFFNPPMAVARFGASPTPLDAFEWRVSRDAQGRVLTVVEPALSLAVASDGTAQPYLPEHIRFKDDDGSVRPVAPFFELWARLQSPEGELSEQPFTLDLLDKLHLTLRHIAVEVHAANLKAARRTDDPACGFQARVAFGGDDHAARPLMASSPHTWARLPWCGPISRCRWAACSGCGRRASVMPRIPRPTCRCCGCASRRPPAGSTARRARCRGPTG